MSVGIALVDVKLEFFTVRVSNEQLQESQP